MNSSDDSNNIIPELTEEIPTLDEEIPTLEEEIPTLDEIVPALKQQIPELNMQVDAPDNYKISFDADNSTETIEQQMTRTRHEYKPNQFEIVEEPTPAAQDHVNELSESELEPETLAEPEPESELQEQAETQTEQAVIEPAKNHSNTFTLVESDPDLATHDSLLQQQYDIELQAIKERAVSQNIEQEALLDKAWIKVETLLMDNLPAQISGSFIELLNAQVAENKQQILEELSLLDDLSLIELSDALDQEDGF